MSDENTEGVVATAIRLNSDDCNAIMGFFLARNMSTAQMLITLGATANLALKNMEHPISLDSALDVVGQGARGAAEQFKTEREAAAEDKAGEGIFSSEALAELAAMPGVKVVSLEDPADLHNALSSIFGEKQ